MAALIDITAVKACRPIAANADVSRYEMFIDSAQNIDLKETLNANCSKDFLYFVTQNTGLDRIKLLLNGGTYEYQGNTYSFVGLKKALALYAYARILEGTQLTVTGNNLVIKRNDWSNEMDTTGVKNMIASARSEAYQYVQEVVLLLCRLSSDYPEYGGYSNPPKSINFTVVDRGQRQYINNLIQRKHYYGDRYKGFDS